MSRAPMPSARRRRFAGVALAAVGLAGAAPAVLELARARAATEPLLIEELARRTADEALRGDERALKARAATAATIPPLRLALAARVNGDTLADLFGTEDWWRAYREAGVTLRIVDGGEVLVTVGSLKLGGQDQEVVAEARRAGAASGRVSVGDRVCLVAAARIERGGAAATSRAADAARAVAPAPVPASKPAGSARGAKNVAKAGRTTHGARGARGARAGRTPAATTAPAPAATAAVGARPSGGDAPVLVLAEAADPARAAAAAKRLAPPPAPRASWLGVVGGGVLALGGLGLALSGRRVREQRWEQDRAGERRRGPSGEVSHPIDDHGADHHADHGAADGAIEPRPAVAGRPSGAAGLQTVQAASAAPSSRQAGDPQIFGRYRLLDQLGQGGMSDVFTARAYGVEGFTRTFVLKRLRPELAREPESIAQFIDEARLQASLVHSNIVPVFDFGRVGEEYFLTQEYIRGRDVVRLLARSYEKRRRTLEPEVAFHVANEVLHALAYAHAKRDGAGQPLGIVHRDVSPANVLVSLAGEVKLFDFGIVKANGRRSKTQAGMVKGNANFMSPEQARGQKLDGRSDLFSVALMLYYCLTNRLIYSGENDLEVLHQAANGPTAEARADIAAMRGPAAALLDRALAVDPDDRFPDAAAFAAAVEPYAAGGKSRLQAVMRELFGDELRDSEAA
jgi:hypothetical protein